MTDSDWTPQEREESFGVIVFRPGANGQEVLLVKACHWGFPKGHAESGEDGLATALREVKEETGILATVEDPGMRHVEEYEIRRDRFTTKKTVTYFIGRGEGTPIPQPGEIADARWVPITEAVGLLTHESARNILKALN
jgi:bis(5'-nucleosidyl)-tetraphosphatase